MISCLKKKLERENGQITGKRSNNRKDPVKNKKYREDEKLTKWSENQTKQANAQMRITQPNSENSPPKKKLYSKS